MLRACCVLSSGGRAAAPIRGTANGALNYTAHPQIHFPPAQEYTYPYLAVLTGTPHHQPTWLLGEYGCKKVGLRSAPSFRLHLETPSLATRTHLQVMLFYHVMPLFSFLNVTALSWWVAAGRDGWNGRLICISHLSWFLLHFHFF